MRRAKAVFGSIDNNPVAFDACARKRGKQSPCKMDPMGPQKKHAPGSITQESAATVAIEGDADRFEATDCLISRNARLILA